MIPLDPAGERSAACPDAELLAAWAEGTLLGSEGPEVEAHLAECTACREVAFAMERPDAVAPPLRVVPRRRSALLATAASLLLAVGAYLVLRGTPAAEPSLQATLARLAREQPDLYGSVALFDPATLAEHDGPSRSALRLLAPIGLVRRGADVRLHWSPLPGATGYRVALVDEGGNVLAQTRTLAPEWTLAAPSVPAGARATLEIRGEGPAGTPLHRAPVRFASDEDEAFRTRVLEAAGAIPPAGGALAPVVAVHALAGRGFYADALAVGDAAPAALRADPAFGRLLEALGRRLGAVSPPR